MPVDSTKKQSEISKNMSLKGVTEPTVEQWEQIFAECERGTIGPVASHTGISYNTLTRRFQKWKANDKSKATAPLKKRIPSKKSDSRSDEENSTDEEDDDGPITFGSNDHHTLRASVKHNDTSTSSDSDEESPRPSKKQKKSRSNKRSRSRSPSPSPSPQKTKKSSKSSKEKKSKKRDESSEKDFMKKAKKRMAAALEDIPAAFNDEAIEYIDHLEKQTITEIRKAAERFRTTLRSNK